MPLEGVFVVDGSPDDSYAALERLLPQAQFRSKLLLHARNFGSFVAIRTGLQAGTGPYYGMIAADLQEPPDLLVSFLTHLVSNECDIVIGVRSTRARSTHVPNMVLIVLASLSHLCHAGNSSRRRRPLRLQRASPQ